MRKDYAMKFHFKEHLTHENEENPKTYHERLLLDLEKTKSELDTAYRGFDYVTDPDLIDCYIYDINAILKRYKFLLEQESLYHSISQPEYMVSDQEPTVTALIG